MTKRCSKCDTYKPLADFNKMTKSPDGRQPRCRECQAAYFQANRERILPQIKARKAAFYLMTVQYVRDYLAGHPCVDCGEADPVVLDFDHVRGTKAANVSLLVKNMAPLVRVKDEIAKCEVRCANCHRRKTAREWGWHVCLEAA